MILSEGIFLFFFILSKSKEVCLLNSLNDKDVDQSINEDQLTTIEKKVVIQDK